MVTVTIDVLYPADLWIVVVLVAIAYAVIKWVIPS